MNLNKTITEIIESDEFKEKLDLCYTKRQLASDFNLTYSSISYYMRKLNIKIKKAL